MSDVHNPNFEVIRPGQLTASEESAAERVRKLATLLDAQFKLPGTNMRMGIDGIIGLIPGIGDAAAMLLAGYIFAEAYRLECRKSTIARMAVNTAIDTIVGAIPVLGDLFDIGFKSNVRNANLILRELEKRRAGLQSGTPPRT